MDARLLRRQLLLTTTVVVGALSGYIGRTYAACPTAGGACTGANLTTQTVDAPNATVTTQPGFYIDTTVAGGNALTITGDGAISYTDANASELTAPGSDDTALTITSSGDIDSGNDGSVLVDTNGNLTGGSYGIRAQNNGSAALEVTTNGSVTGNTGISANNGTISSSDGTSLTVTTGAGTTVEGTDSYGIDARNYGDEALEIMANGHVTGGSTGISANNYGTSLTVTTGATVDGGGTGILAQNDGSAALEVTANGNVTGGSTGISANNGSISSSAGTSLTVTTGAGTTVEGTGSYGIRARNYGSAALEVTANGSVTGGVGGISANNDGTSLTVTTGAGTTVEGTGNYGIRARNYGDEALEIMANGSVTGGVGGISANNDGTSLIVTTGAGTTVEGTANHGIDAHNDGNDALEIMANGSVTGGVSGIVANNSNSGTNLTVTTAAGTTVEGANSHGIDAENEGNGALEITANGSVTGDGSGILARNHGTNLTVTTGPGIVDGANGDGIRTTNDGDGVLRITANGDITGASRGIAAENNGSGALTIETHGDVTGKNSFAIYAKHGTGGPINITVGATSTVTSDGTDSFDVAIETFDGAANIVVAGVLNGGGGGAIQFDQGVDDRLELRPSAKINGIVRAGSGNNTLAFGGPGEGDFDLTNIDTGGGTEQYRQFDNFQVDGGIWSFTGATVQDFLVNGGTLGGTGRFGDVIVNGGTLGGSGIFGNVTVNGGTVMGTGTFVDLLANGGTIAPGNSIGTLTVNGAFTLSSGAVYEVEANGAGQSDKVIVNGMVNLTGATLRVLAEDGNYKPKTDYTIIENDGTDAVVGEFAQMTSSLAFLTPAVFYNGGDGNDVVLTLERNATLFQDVARTRNQKAVAGALDQFPTDSPLFLAVLNQTAQGAHQAFDALSGEIHATVAGTLADDSRYVREAVLGRLMQASHAGEALAAGGPQVASLDSQAYALGYDGKSLIDASERAPLAFWTSAFGAWGDWDSDGNAASANRDLGGFVSGMDADVGNGWRAGLATGASFSNVDVDARYSSADVETYHLGGYAGGMAGSFALRGGGMWAWNSIDTSRAVLFPGFFERQKASYDADTGQLFGEVAYPTQMGGTAVEPFGGLAYVTIDSDSFREHGGALGSLRGSTDQDVGYSTLGLRAATMMQFGGMQVTPHLSAAWQHAFDDVTTGAALAFASTGIGFGVEGVPLAQDSVLIGAGLDLALGERTTAGLSYTGQFGDGLQDNGIKGRFTWLF